jgi:exodeoxyribonuclease-3
MPASSVDLLASTGPRGCQGRVKELPTAGPVPCAVVRLATWNVNSLAARLPRVEAWVREFQPDVLCLQETKCADDAFPSFDFATWGYESVPYGEGRWNGVAIASRIGVDDIRPGLEDADLDVEARLLTVRCGDVHVATAYVPNGRSLDAPQYGQKLAWLARLEALLAERFDPAVDPVVLCGDLNIAPDDRDVYDPALYVGTTHTSGPEREAFGRLVDWGLVDVFRARYEVGGLFSWWDYRAGNFHKGKGMRIDHVLASPPLAERVAAVLIVRNAR